MRRIGSLREWLRRGDYSVGAAGIAIRANWRSALFSSAFQRRSQQLTVSNSA
jgi:hypothetical protein